MVELGKRYATQLSLTYIRAWGEPGNEATLNCLCCFGVWYVYIVLLDNCRVLRDVESVRQEATLLREQMQIVKEDIKKVSPVVKRASHRHLRIPVQLFIACSACVS